MPLRRVAFSVVLALGCAPPTPPTPEAELRAVAQDIVRAIEAADPQGVLRYVAVDFAEEGGLTYPDVHSAVLHFLFRDEQVGAHLEELSIQPPAKEGAPHRLRARLAFARGQRLSQRQRPLPAGVVRYEFDLLFTESESGWQTRGGRYRRL